MEMAVHLCKTALLLIDLQESFINGDWMQHVANMDVQNIKRAFDNSVTVLKQIPPKVEVAMSQTIFYRKKDFNFYSPVNDIVQQRPYKILLKPGNNIREADGADEWIENIIASDIKTLVIGGGTTNSCVRVSAVEVQRKFGPKGLNVTVDLSLCGARDSNYKKRCSSCLKRYMVDSSAPLCGQCEREAGDLMSPVDLAVKQMREAGVNVINKYDWKDCSYPNE